jgi:hypothetical protein
VPAAIDFIRQFIKHPNSSKHQTKADRRDLSWFRTLIDAGV